MNVLWHPGPPLPGLSEAVQAAHVLLRFLPEVEAWERTADRRQDWQDDDSEDDFTRHLWNELIWFVEAYDVHFDRQNNEHFSPLRQAEQRALRKGNSLYGKGKGNNLAGKGKGNRLDGKGKGTGFMGAVLPLMAQRHGGFFDWQSD